MTKEYISYTATSSQKVQKLHLFGAYFLLYQSFQFQYPISDNSNLVILIFFALQNHKLLKSVLLKNEIEVRKPESIMLE